MYRKHFKSVKITWIIQLIIWSHLNKITGKLNFLFMWNIKFQMFLKPTLKKKLNSIWRKFWKHFSNLGVKNVSFLGRFFYFIKVPSFTKLLIIVLKIHNIPTLILPPPVSTCINIFPRFPYTPYSQPGILTGTYLKFSC